MLDRTCRNCKYFNSIDSTCNEGGYSEIGNPDEVRSNENCNAWREGEKKINNDDVKYFLFGVVIQDGEYQYHNKFLVKGKSHKKAEKRVDNIGLEMIKEWYGVDGFERDLKIESQKEITKEVARVLKKFLVADYIDSEQSGDLIHLSDVEARFQDLNLELKNAELNETNYFFLKKCISQCK